MVLTINGSASLKQEFDTLVVTLFDGLDQRCSAKLVSSLNVECEIQ